MDSEAITKISIKEIYAAKNRIDPYILKTDLYRALWLEKILKFNQPIYLKLENQQITGSFKLRGAMNKLLLLTENDKKKGDRHTEESEAKTKTNPVACRKTKSTDAQ